MVSCKLKRNRCARTHTQAFPTHAHVLGSVFVPMSIKKRNGRFEASNMVSVMLLVFIASFWFVCLFLSAFPFFL